MNFLSPKRLFARLPDTGWLSESWREELPAIIRTLRSADT